MHILVLRPALRKDAKRSPLVSFWLSRMTQTGQEGLSCYATMQWFNQTT